MDRDKKSVPESNDPLQQPSCSTQNVSTFHGNISNPQPLRFAGGSSSTSNEQNVYGADEMDDSTQQILCEIMLGNIMEWINNDRSLSDALYERIGHMDVLESFNDPQSSNKNALKGEPSSDQNTQKGELSAQTQYEMSVPVEPGYEMSVSVEPGPSTSQTMHSDIHISSECIESAPIQWYQENNVIRFYGISNITGSHVRSYRIPAFAKPVFTQTNPRYPPATANVDQTSNVLPISKSKPTFQRQSSQRRKKSSSEMVISLKKFKIDEPLLQTSSKKFATFSSQPSTSSILQTSSPSTSKSTTTTQPSTSESRLPHAVNLPNLRLTAPPLNSLQVQLLLQNTIKMGVTFHSYTSNVNYQLCEPMKNLIISEQSSDQFSPMSENSQNSSSLDSPCHSSSSLEKTTKEKPPTIADLGPDDLSAPDTLYRSALKLAMKKTHILSRRIRWSRIFFVPTELCPAVQTSAELALGVCVTYEQECEERWCKIRCHRETFICLHMYSCTCPQKNKLFGWCSHIHAATYCGLRRFRSKTLAFVPTTSGLMKIHHLRAKYKYMKLVKKWPEDLKEELKTLEMQGTIKQVRTFSCVCPRYKRCKECTACYCNFKCKCIDYRRLRFPCEHIHYLVMCIRRDVSTVLQNEFRHYDYHTDDSDDETDKESLNFVEDHHQRSFCIKRKKIKQVSVDSWTVKSNRSEMLEYKVKSFRRHDKTPGEQNKCTQCTSRQAFNWIDCCVECAVCPHDYKCSCDENKTEKKMICKHIHAVIRNFVQKRKHTSDTDEFLAQGTMYSSSESDESDSQFEAII